MNRMEYKGRLDATGKRFALVVSRFNELISRELLDGAIDCFERHNAEEVAVVWVPGAFEIPGVVLWLARAKKFAAVVALGAIIRGDTPHADYLATEVVKGLANVSLETGIPITCGVITAETLEQALERAGAKQGNKGFNAALAAIELANLALTLSA